MHPVHPVLSFSYQRTKFFWQQFSRKGCKILRVTHSVSVRIITWKRRESFIPATALLDVVLMCTVTARAPSFRSWWILWFSIWRNCQECHDVPLWQPWEVDVEKIQPQAWICSYSQVQISPIYNITGKIPCCVSAHITSTSQRIGKVTLLWRTVLFNSLHQGLKI